MEIKQCHACGRAIRVTPKKLSDRNYCSRSCYLTGDPRPVEERFWQFVRKEESCWRWIGSIGTGGYGQMYRRDTGKPERAHRVSHFIAHGVYPPTGAPIHHVCHNRWCVNPAHLQLLTSREHYDAHPVTSKPRHYANRTTCNHGHPIDGDGAYHYSYYKRLCKACCRIRQRKYRARIKGTAKHAEILARRRELKRARHAALGPKSPV